MEDIRWKYRVASYTADLWRYIIIVTPDQRTHHKREPAIEQTLISVFLATDKLQHQIFMPPMVAGSAGGKLQRCCVELRAFSGCATTNNRGLIYYEAFQNRCSIVISKVLIPILYLIT